MTLPVLITLAILLPVGIFLGLFLFAKGTSWVASRPRVWSVAMMTFGLAYAVAGAWSAREDFGTEAAVFVAGGALYMVGGIYHCSVVDR